ncbi:MAG: NAD-dependent epimerase/dehydratase family protein [Candidatus Abyssobacteria bacterium SURF_5]|uniref:NAD-dependent epimerase/dehydratase family protein n=1 Tax=Abyssobacteria bacterium (strain SURF_5) TaxID=2093360 RepID=A0A3A4NS18_ABYX5|nr:MAG: NAD-dependent epimerase/dehydratase family protein [Candidatus Abyssubacteria bacterium SURF_5]
MNVFVTGASGFIGSNLCKRLVADGNRVYALARNPTEQSGEGLSYVRGDILNPKSFQAVLHDCDLIFHCAACVSFDKKDYPQAFEVNVEGTERILEAAHRAGVKKVVHLSACAVLGFSTTSEKVLDEAAAPPISKDNVYAYTKKMAEEKVLEYVRKGLDVSIANIATVYGAGDRKLNSGSVIKSVYEGKMRFVPPGGTSFVSVEDVVEGLILIARNGRPGERYILCSENMEYRQLVNRISAVLQVKRPLMTLPSIAYYPAVLAVTALNLLAPAGGDQVNLVTPQIVRETFGYKYFSSEKARRELGWHPARTFEEAVGSAFEYYRREGLL